VTGVRYLYVFDLDGTLADTAGLSSGRRSPELLLKEDPLDPSVSVGPERWALVNELGLDMSAVPGEVRVAGHAVAVVTRAPAAYASTLAGLLELERVLIWPSTAVSVPDKLVRLAEFHRIPLGRVVYVGDTGDDRAAARSAGCRFVSVDDFEMPEDNESEPFTGVNEDSVSDIVSSLRLHPRHRRREYQARLARIVTPAHRYCLVPPHMREENLAGAFTEAGLGPELFTRDERGETYLRMLRNLFPARRTSRVRPSAGDSYYICGYVNLGDESSPTADPLGGLLRVIKDYKSTSGPEVRLGSLPLVRDVLASHLASWFRGFDDIGGFLIDHVAPNAFSASTPGRFSSRLTRSVADRVGSQLGTEWNAVTTVHRSRSGLTPNLAFDGTPVWAVLIDDQRTTGRGLGRHIDTSPLPEWEATLTWSHSRPPTPTHPDPALSRATPDCYWPDAGDCPEHGPGIYLQPQSTRNAAPVVPRAPTEVEINPGAANVISTLKTYPQAWAKWEPEDDETLARLVAEDRSTIDMARIMGRTPGAISSRVRKMRDGLI